MHELFVLWDEFCAMFHCSAHMSPAMVLRLKRLIFKGNFTIDSVVNKYWNLYLQSGISMVEILKSRLRNNWECNLTATSRHKLSGLGKSSWRMAECISRNQGVKTVFQKQPVYTYMNIYCRSLYIFFVWWCQALRTHIIQPNEWPRYRWNLRWIRSHPGLSENDVYPQVAIGKIMMIQYNPLELDRGFPISDKTVLVP